MPLIGATSGATAGSQTGTALAVGLTITEAGAFTLVLEHDPDEVLVEVVSASGETLTPAAVEEAGEHDEHEHDEDEHDEDEHDEDEHDEGGNKSATGRQWANAIAASLVLSLCRFVFFVFSQPVVVTAIELHDLYGGHSHCEVF